MKIVIDQKPFWYEHALNPEGNIEEWKQESDDLAKKFLWIASTPVPLPPPLTGAYFNFRRSGEKFGARIIISAVDSSIWEGIVTKFEDKEGIWIPTNSYGCGLLYQQREPLVSIAANEDLRDRIISIGMHGAIPRELTNQEVERGLGCLERKASQLVDMVFERHEVVSLQDKTVYFNA